MIFEIGFVTSFALGLSQGRKWFAVTVLAGIMLFLTLSRGGWAGALVGMAVTWAVYRWREPAFRRRMWRLTGLVIVAVSSASALSMVVGQPSWLFRATLGDRVPAMLAGMEMLSARPLFGHGPGTFLLLLDGYVGDQTYAGTSRVVWNHSHNGFVQLLQELGVWGALVMAGAAALLVRSTATLARSEDSGNRRRGAMVLGCSAAFAVHSLVDVVTIWVGPVVLLAALAGALVQSQNLLLPDMPTRWVGVLASVPLTLFLTATLPAQHVYEQGLDLAMSGEWAGAAARFQRAASLDALPAYGLANTVAMINAGLVDSDIVDSLASRALRLPTDSSAQLNYAIAATGVNPDLGWSVVDEIKETINGDEVGLIQLGLLLDNAGLAVEADDAYVRALRVNRWLIDSPIWAEIPDGQNRLREAKSILAREDDCGLIEASFTSALTNPVTATTTCPLGSVAELHRLAYIGDWDELSRQSAERLTQTPDDPVAHRIQGVVSMALNDITAARRAWATAALLGDSYSALRLLETYPAGDTPREILDLALTVSSGQSPVRLDPPGHPIYVLGSSRFLVTHRRLPLPSPLAGADWATAVTSIHQGLVNAILRALPTDGG
jgi:tetratricopeptide (TPR) repeat protein